VAVSGPGNQQVRGPGTAPIIAKDSEQFLGEHAGVPKGGDRRLVPPVILQCMSPLPLAAAQNYVRLRGYSGREMLAARLSHFDPLRSFGKASASA
jgi:hypothetical protein